MIYLKDLTNADKNRLVVYSKGRLKQLEEGIITSWNDTFIFVKYGKDITSKATYPQDLDWAIKSPYGY